VSLPHLERLAREGVVFDQATSVAPLTLPAHTTLFTGLLPPNHGVRDNADAPLAKSQTTLAEILLARGFRSGAFVGSMVLDPDRGLKQGFEQYRGVGETDRQTPETRQRRADEVMADAIRWLDTIASSRFFLWTHLYDAHRPYDPPEPYRSIYGHNLYVGEIAFADSQVGRLLEALEQRHLLDRTVVIVTGDHGFEDVQRVLFPNQLLAAAGLRECPRAGAGWRATVHIAGGAAAVFVNPAGDLTTALRAETALRSAGSDRLTIVSRHDLDALGAMPGAALAIEPAPGFELSGSCSSTAPRFETGTLSNHLGMHGYLPSRPSRWPPRWTSSAFTTRSRASSPSRAP